MLGVLGINDLASVAFVHLSYRVGTIFLALFRHLALDRDGLFFLFGEPLPKEKERLIEVLAEVRSWLGMGGVVGAVGLV